MPFLLPIKRVYRVKKLISVFAIVFIIAGCQQESANQESAKQESAKSEPVKAEAAKEPTNTLSPEEKSEPKAHDESGSHEGHNHPPQGAVPAGQRYTEIESQFECSEPVVIEFFAYHCPHCYKLEPEAEKWRAKNAGNVKFLGIPTTLGYEQFGSLIIVHHAAKKLGVLEKTQHALFNRLHKEEKLFASPEEAAQFLVAQGAELEAAKAALNDQQALTVTINQDFEMLRKYKVSSVPQILVNHKYLTNITAAGGNEKVFDLVDELLALPHECGEAK